MVKLLNCQTAKLLNGQTAKLLNGQINKLINCIVYYTNQTLNPEL